MVQLTPSFCILASTLALSASLPAIARGAAIPPYARHDLEARDGVSANGDIAVQPFQGQAVNKPTTRPARQNAAFPVAQPVGARDTIQLASNGTVPADPSATTDASDPGDGTDEEDPTATDATTTDASDTSSTDTTTDPASFASDPSATADDTSDTTDATAADSMATDATATDDSTDDGSADAASTDDGTSGTAPQQYAPTTESNSNTEDSAQSDGLNWVSAL